MKCSSPRIMERFVDAKSRLARARERERKRERETSIDLRRKTSRFSALSSHINDVEAPSTLDAMMMNRGGEYRGPDLCLTCTGLRSKEWVGGSPRQALRCRTGGFTLKRLLLFLAYWPMPYGRALAWHLVG